VKKISHPTTKQTPKNTPTPKQNLPHKQTCDRIKTEKPTQIEKNLPPKQGDGDG
jgi:hypothetical protein